MEPNARLNDLTIRKFRPKDIDFAYEMVAKERWNDRREDIKRMFNYEPNGCFIAETNHDSVGHVFSINYGNLAGLGCL